MTLTAFSLAGHTILITGASSGIGRTISIRASQMGARVVLLGRDMTRLDETLAMLDGKDHLSVSMDLLKLHEIESALTPLLKSTGPLHGFVHSAGMAPTVLLRDLDTDRTEYLMRLNWLSFMALSQAICRRGRYAPGLSVVALASISALTGQVGLSAYAGTKGALIASVRSLASEYAPRGIRFNCISPCPVDTPMQRETRARLGEEWYRKEVLEKARLGPLAPEDIADPVLFLLSDASRRITGTNMIVDGGWSLS